MRVTGDWLTHPGTQALCAVLEGAGYRALFVGGCVRNALLGVSGNAVCPEIDAEHMFARRQHRDHGIHACNGIGY